MTRKIVFPLLMLILLCWALAAGAEVEFMGHSYPEDAAYVDLGTAVVKDYDALESFLAQFPNLRQVDMWATEIPAKQCDRLAERFPGVKWGWTMVLQGRDHKHLIRTDYTSWSTLHNNKSSLHTSEDFHILKYCWNLLALDIGHNGVTDLNFLYDLPHLRVLIIAANKVEDLTPVASLKDLEYLELFKNRVQDLTPLTGLTHLMDLNMCNNKVKDLSPLESMTWLKRLWIYQATGKDIPKQTGRQLQASLPDTQVDYTHSGTNGTWRMVTSKKRHPHYQAIIDTFGENHLKPKYEYVPFEDSFPLTESEPAGEPAGIPLPEDGTQQGGTSLLTVAPNN